MRVDCLVHLRTRLEPQCCRSGRVQQRQRWGRRKTATAAGGQTIVHQAEIKRPYRIRGSATAHCAAIACCELGTKS